MAGPPVTVAPGSGGSGAVGEPGSERRSVDLGVVPLVDRNPVDEHEPVDAFGRLVALRELAVR